MKVGRSGETKFAYAREVVLGFFKYAPAQFESVALYGVDDDSIVAHYRTEASNAAMDRLRGPLFSLSPLGEKGLNKTNRPNLSRRARNQNV